MNGILNIQVRALTAQAQAQLKALEREIAAVERATAGQSVAQKNLSVAQEHNRNTARALTAAHRELAAAERAVTAATAAQQKASGGIAKATAAQTASVSALAAAEAKLALQKGLVKRAAALNTTMRQKAANDAAKIATLNLAEAEARLAAVQAARASATGAGNGTDAAHLAATNAVTKAKIRLAAAERRVYLVGNLSANSKLRNVQAAAALARAEAAVTAAQAKATAASEALTAAHANLAAGDARLVAAEQKVVAATNAVTAAQERAVVASAALRNAQAAQAAASAAAGAGAAAAAGGGFAAATNGMRKFGSQTQWAGRQLTTNFGMPVLLVGGLATKFALDNEKAMTRVKKVYGELDMALDKSPGGGAEILAAELKSLEKAFTALSNHYGIHQKEVIEIGAAWAAAGSSGVGLAKSVENTLRIMSLGEMEAVEATKALISIQSQYDISSQDLTKTIAQLNIVENQTGASLSDLIVAFQRTAGIAKVVGIDTRHLSAYIAALTPAAGSAANAGNALKTMMARLFAPTNAAREILGAMGIQVDQMGWKSATGAERIQTVSDAFHKLDDAQKAQVASYQAGNFQVARFITLMEEVHGNTTDATKSQSQFQRAMKATANESQYLIQAENELNAVLESNPQKLKQVMVILQNTMATAITPAIPTIIMLAAMIQKAFEAFQNLPPIVRKSIIGFVLFAATLGILLRLIGTFIILLSYIAKMMRVVALAVIFLGKAIRVALIRPLILLVGAISAPVWGIIAAVALITATIMLVPGVADKVVNGVQSAFNRLPEGIQSAMMAVVNIVHSAVMAVYRLFSYLNPFARHSPSLVENVTNGMAVIKSEFGSITQISGPINKAYANIKRFNDATAQLRKGLDSMARAEDLKELVKLEPGAADEFRALVKDLQFLKPVMDRLEESMNAQQKVVDKWKQKLDQANEALDRQTEKLEKLQEKAREYENLLEDAKGDLEKFASAPLVGMRAMEDAIFDNEMAQKALRLEMMNLEDVAGPIDSLKDRMARLAGQIEYLRGEQTSLREAGAGSDILSFYDDQIAALEAQQGTINDTSSQYNELEGQLKDLQRASERLDLEKSLNFDGLNRTIDQTAHAIEELPFDVIMAGIDNANERIEKYSGKLDTANAAVDAQQKKVDAAQKSVDSINTSYDAQQAKLDNIAESYDKVRDAVNDVEGALNDMVSAAEAANSAAEKAAKGGYKSNAMRNFEGAAGGNFPEAGGKGGIEREVGDIDAWTKELENRTKALGERIDIFGPMKRKWAEFKGWWTGTVVPGFQDLFALTKPETYTAYGATFFTDKEFDTGLGKAVKKAQEVKDKIGRLFSKPTTYTMTNEKTGESHEMPGANEAGPALKALQSVGQGALTVLTGLKNVVMLFWPELKMLGEVLWDNIIKAWKTWKPEVERLAKALGDFWRSPLQPLINILLVLAGIIGVALLGVLKVLARIIVEVLGRALDFIIDIVGDVLQVFSGLLTFLSGVFSLDFALMWEGIKTIVTGTFEAIWHVIEGFVSIIWGVIKGFVEGIVGFFKWLWDVLVGHSIIPDMCNAIFDWFKALPGRILSALAALGEKLVELIKAAWALFMEALKTAWSGTLTFIKSIPGKIYDAFMAYVDLVTSIGSKIMGWIKSGLSSAWDTVSSWIGDKVDWVVKKFGDIKSSLAGKFSGMFDGIKDAFRGAINWIVGAWNGLEFKIPGFDPPGPGPKFDGFTLGVPDIPYLARGGTARANKLHVVGELGPELFIPRTTGRVVSNNDIASLMKRAVQDAFSTLQSAPLSQTVKVVNPGALTGAVARADARAAGAGAPVAPVQNVTVNNNVEIHLHGDLSFPNIKSGEDAEMFITNLSDLAG